MTPTTDFWDDAAGNTDVPEPAKPVYDNIPDGVNLIVRTTCSTDKDTVHPKVKPIDRKDGSGEFYRFKAPVVVLGGEGKLDAKYVGRYLFLDLNVEKPTVEQLTKAIATATANGNDATVKRFEGQLKALDKYPCAPELYNLILDTLAPEGDKAADRWPVAVAVLKAKAKEMGYTAENHKGNTELLFANTFKDVLLAGSYNIIGRTYTSKQKEGSTFEPQQTLGSIGSDTEEQRKKRKVKLIDPPVKEEAF